MVTGYCHEETDDGAIDKDFDGVLWHQNEETRDQPSC